MAQVAHRIETESAFEALSADYAAKFAAFEVAADAAKASKADNAASAKALRVAERALMWAAFDVAMVAESPETDLSERFESIAARKGIEGKNLAVYRLRARDAITCAIMIKAADREKTSPYTLAKKWREGADARAERVTQEAAHIDGAETDAATDLGVTLATLRAMVRNGDPLATSAVSVALNARIDRANVVADAQAFRARLASLDPETLAAVGAVFAGLA